MKPVKATHSKKIDFFPMSCIHLRLVVKYRFISEFPPNKRICVDDFCLVTVSRDFQNVIFKKKQQDILLRTLSKVHEIRGVLIVIKHK